MLPGDGKRQPVPCGHRRLSGIAALPSLLCSVLFWYRVLPEQSEHLTSAGGTSPGLPLAGREHPALCCQALGALLGEARFGPELVLSVPGWQKKSVHNIWPAWSRWEEQTTDPVGSVCWEIPLPVHRKGS